MNQVLNEKERLLEQVINKDIVNIILNSIVVNASVNVHECKKCLKLETELFNKKDFIEKETYDKLFKSYTTLEKHCISLEVDTHLNQEIFQRDNYVSNQSALNFDQYFELNELKAQSQEKDTVIRKLKEIIKSLTRNMNKDTVKKDIEEIETINIEFDHRVSKLIVENEHLKQNYKQLYDSIKPTRTRSKEQCDALVSQVNQKSIEIFDLNASLQEKDLVITTLKNEVRKLKGKDLADNVVTKHPVALEMLKVDIQAMILKEVVEQGKSQNPLNNPLDSALGNACPLTRIATTAEVPLRKPTALESDTPKPVVTLVYSRKPRKSKTNVPVSKPKIIKSISANKKEPSKSWGSISFDIPSPLFENAVIAIFSVKFGNDHVAKVAFRQHTCFIRNLEGVDLLTGSGFNNLYTLSLRDIMASSPICLLSKASKTKSWLWHRHLSHLNFGAINHLARHGLARGLPKLKFEKDHLCSTCAMGKSKKKPHKPKSKDTNQEKLYLLHMDLCDPMRVASVNGKKLKDEAPNVIIKFLKMIQLRLKAPIRQIRTDNGTEFVNQTLREYYEKVGISYETSVARSPQQNGVVERHNYTLIEAARTMLIYAKALLFLWAEVVATACYTQNRSIIRLRHGKTPYELLHDKLPDLSFFYIFGALCYLTNDSENLDKLQLKADIDFDELTTMASEHSSLDTALHEMTPAIISLGLVPNPYNTPILTNIAAEANLGYYFIVQQS
ncbi:retrovirus-related pol polyprotein from transposon TNT 1-94 [Tanacetum coccineum]